MSATTPAASRLKAVRALALAGAFALTAGALTACDNAGGGATDDSKTIGVLMLVQSDEAGQRILGAINKQLAEYPDYSISIIDANYDPSKELAGMDTFINKGVDGIITVFTDNELLKAKLSLAGQQDIPVVAVAGGAAVDGVTANIDTPEEDAGAALAQQTLDDMAAAGKSELIKMVLPEAVPCKRRVAGMDTVLSQHPEITQVEYHIDGGNPVPAAKDYLASRLSSDDDLGGILSCWDVPMMGALTAVEAAGVDGDTFAGAGINGTSDAVQAMQDGDPYVDALVTFGWANAGYSAVETIHSIFTGADFTAEAEVQWEVLTPENVPAAPLLEPEEWLPEGWGADYWTKN